MAGHSGLGGGGIFCDQILFHRRHCVVVLEQDTFILA